jgi:TPR repeat protein
MTHHMKILFYTAFCFSISLVSVHAQAQTPAELNARSKIFLARRDYHNAFPLIRQAAEQGNPEAQYNYGECFLQAVEVPQSDSLANAWFLKSAQRGWRDAQYKISYSYETGRGITKDAAQAFYWSLQCALQNDAECMFNVIGCYMSGVGTPQNHDSMLVWAIRLGTMPNPDDLALSGKITSARANLGTMYRDGLIVPKDSVRAYMWFLIYNENKRDFSIPDQEHFITAIQALGQTLTAAEKKQTVADAEKLLNRKLRNLDRLGLVDEQG